MNQNKFMLGDLVQVNGRKGIIKELYSRKACIFFGEEYSSIYTNRFPYEEIEPVHLTKEILKAHGVSEKSAMWCHDFPLPDSCFFLHSLENGTGVWEVNMDYYGEDLFIAYVKSVHELQHFLITIGNDSLAEEFRNIKQMKHHE